MSGWFPVSAARLHDRSLEHDGVRLERVTLFPFFDGNGRTRRVLIVRADSADLRTFCPADVRLRFGWLRPIRSSDLQASLRRAEDDPALIFGGLWHFDPWWLLTAPRFRREAVVPRLKATNCVRRFASPVKRLYYRRDLSAVNWIVRQSSDGWTLDRFQPQMLPSPPRFEEPIAAAAPKSGWRLDPFWERSPHDTRASHEPLMNANER